VKPWQQQIIRDAADQPDASFTALARWAGIHSDTLLKARKRDPEFDQAITDARAGNIAAGKVVGIEEFTRSKHFLGLGVRGLDEGGTIYPRVLDHLEEINSGDYSLAIMSGGIGCAKTMSSVISMVFQLYLLLSEPDPHKFLNLEPSSKILFVLQNRNVRLSKLNAYALFRNLVERCPWFQQNAPHDARLKSSIQFLKRDVAVWAVGGDAESVLGMNIYAALLDEANFHDVTAKSKRSVTDDRTYDAARESFEGLVRRKLSRLDEDKGFVFVSSSRRYRGEFTSQLTDEYGTDPRTYLFDETAWSVNPEAYENGKWFYVFQGDQQRPARILAEDEETSPKDRDLVVRVPEKFRRQFRSNITRSLQDLAGRSLERVGTYFTDRAALRAAACLQNVLMSKSDVVADAMELMVAPHAFTLQSPTSPRAIHADLSLSGDSTGVAIAHIGAFDDEGRPLIICDGLARIAPPKFGQIDLDSIYRLIAAWRQAGVPIEYFSCDNFQSADLMQRVSRLGIRVGRISVDMTSPSNPTEAYESLRCSVVESRIKFPHDETVIDELLALELDRKKMRVDHPPQGSKDSADALAGVTFQLSRLNAWQLVEKVKNAGFAAAMATPSIGGTVTGYSGASALSEMDRIRISRGMPLR
jgi:hypothetical protein